MSEINNEEVGKYLSELIKMNFKSTRQFCIACLKEAEEPNDASIRNMENRISQIKKGAKAVQTTDLPVFSKLLGVSIEQILSGGKEGEREVRRLSNRSVANSLNKEIWNEYLSEKNKCVLITDEDKKTVLDYATEFGNYEFVKFLTEEGYICFDCDTCRDDVMIFGIVRNMSGQGVNGFFDAENVRYLIIEKRLRQALIKLAAENNDISMLRKLRAREIRELYFNADYLARTCPDIRSCYDEVSVDCISKSSDEVLDYFTEPFEITGVMGRKHKFVYPYISELLDFLVKNKRRYLKTALERMIDHNAEVLKSLEALVNTSENCYDGDEWKNNEDFCENGNIVYFRNRKDYRGIITNIATVRQKTDDNKTNLLIRQLNELYERIENFNK